MLLRVILDIQNLQDALCIVTSCFGVVSPLRDIGIFAAMVVRVVTHKFSTRLG